MPRALEEGKSSYQGRLCQPRDGYDKESAEAIVTIGNEPRIETVEDSPDSEGPNVKLFQMLQGSLLCKQHLALI
jgi:hypothetical protein